MRPKDINGRPRVQATVNARIYTAIETECRERGYTEPELLRKILDEWVDRRQREPIRA